MNQIETMKAERKDNTVNPIPRWLRTAVLPLLPACLAFGPIFMVIPETRWINFAGALMLGMALCVLFIAVGRRLFPPE